MRRSCVLSNNYGWRSSSEKIKTVPSRSIKQKENKWKNWLPIKCLSVSNPFDLFYVFSLWLIPFVRSFVWLLTNAFNGSLFMHANDRGGWLRSNFSTKEAVNRFDGGLQVKHDELWRKVEKSSRQMPRSIRFSMTFRRSGRQLPRPKPLKPLIEIKGFDQ